MPHSSRITLIPAFLLVPLVSGCMTTAHLMSAATTSPGEKWCGFHVALEKLPTSLNSMTLQIKGGFSGHEQEMNLAATVRQRGELGERWILDGYKNYWQDNRSCVAVSPIKVKLDDGMQQWFAEIPIEDIGTQAVFGDYYLSFKNSRVELVLYENVGKTKYGAASMSMGWALEPRKVISSQQLNEASK